MINSRGRSLRLSLQSASFAGPSRRANVPRLAVLATREHAKIT